MDQERARDVLEWWIEHAPEARSTGNTQSSDGRYTFSYETAPTVIELRTREDQTRRVIARVLGHQKLPVLLRSFSSDAVSLVEGIVLARQALARVLTDAETRAILGSTAPTMAADGLHPTIWNSASGRWDAGHFSDAVQRAATFLNAEIQDRTGRRDISDAALMKEVFSLDVPTPERPRLRWPGADDDQTVRAMRVGMLNYAQGVYSAIRNPATHGTNELQRQEALEQLAALSVLARWTDQCELLDAG
jgi:hypothetical protein